MPDQYNYTGYFYTKEGYRLRSYLNIRKKSGWFAQGLRRVKSRIGVDTPDVMVVMMNPGASSPLEGGDDGRAEYAAKPDLTQKQIARVMGHCGFSYARILNLSDSFFAGRIRQGWIQAFNSSFKTGQQDRVDEIVTFGRITLRL